MACLCLLLFSSFTYMFYTRTASINETNIQKRLSANYQYVISKIDSKVNDIFSTLEAYETFIGAYDSLEDEAIYQAFREISEKEQFLKLAIDNAEGLCYDVEDQNYDVHDRAYFKEAMSGKRVVSEVIDSRRTGQPSIIFAIPIYRDKQTIGVLHTAIAINDILEVFNMESLDDMTYVTIGDKEGNYIVGNDENIKFEKGKEKTNASGQQEGYIEYSNMDTKTDYYGYYGYSTMANWSVFVSVEQAVMNQEFGDIMNVSYLFAFEIAVGLLLFGILVFWLEHLHHKKTVLMTKEIDDMLKNLPGGALCYYCHGKNIALQFISEGASHLFGLTKQECYQQLQHDYYHYIHPKDRPTSALLEVEENNIEKYYRIIDKTGAIKWVYDCKQVIHLNDVDKRIYISLVDVTSKMDVQEKLRISEERLRMVIDVTDTISFEYDIIHDTIQFSKAWHGLTGYPLKIKNARRKLGEMVVKKWRFIFDEKQIKEKNGIIDSELQIYTVANQKIWVKVKGKLIACEEGKSARVIGMLEDIDSIKKENKRLHKKALVDGLTGIYNKVTTQKMIEEKLMHGSNDIHQVLFIIDLDDFKYVNDTYGHLQGDEVLRKIAFNVASTFRSNDIVGRIGGDEFVVLMCDVTDENLCYVEIKAKQLIEAIQSIAINEEQSKFASCSIGIAISEENSEYTTLFRQADKALYSVKGKGKLDYCIYKQR